jgi:predicted regulator of Ras-like GTPase activity (Roadblock/LC7/MglB family)
MDSILKEINTVGGVSGSFVCDEVGEVMALAMPNVFDAETARTVGRAAAQTLSSLQMARRRKIGEVDLVYAGGRVIVKAMTRGYLIILCVRNVNVPLLNLTANMALKRLAAEMNRAKESMPAPVPQAAKPASQPAPVTPVEPVAPEIAAAPAPEPKADPLSAAIPALADLAEALISGAEELGVRRTTLLTILEPRYRTLMPKYRFLNERSFSFGKLTLDHFTAGVPSTEAVAALSELIGEIYRSGSDFLKPDQAKSLYQLAYQAVARKNGAVLQHPAVQKMLPQPVPLISQPAPATAAPAVVSAPQTKNGSLSVAVPALANLAEALIGGAEKQGVNRSTLLTILDSRYRTIMSKYHLNESSFVSGKFDLSHWSEAEISPADAVEALGEMVNEIYHAETRLLGRERVKALYQQAYQSVAQKDSVVLQQPTVQAMLPQRG